MLLSIIGNMLTTSKLTRMALKLRFELSISSIISNTWHVSLIRDGNSLANLKKTFSIKMDKFSTAVLQPLVVTLTGLFSLCVLTLPYIYSAVELREMIKDLHLSKNFLLCHFSIQLLTFISNCLLGS